ncbi:LysR family hydrogen peroxide-inducible transcriptional activator [Novosphingobium sp. SG751A]|uniref:LysR family transcriptional regulator n=1 Tax=Novosphingobium sp. SG751A TaxID=2587000 RepID=UPI001554CF3C|nr:LysR family transcriptional regulator [Novosphingobium sp. SG751A]NOW44924.1 LysR family hydrogen peroxide-inducible transcriptional activator [Novosphingobium sp. SG751A]
MANETPRLRPEDPSKRGTKIDAPARRPNASRPDFHQLETFLKVSEARSFAAAARQLGVSQPAVSQTIARLEDIYGADLFERRRGSPVTLTPIGQAILPSAKLLLFTVDRQIERALATAQSRAGSLAIGIHPALAFGPLGDALIEIRDECPDVQFQLVEGPPGDLYRRLNEQTLDIMFMALHPDVAGGANVQERLWADPLVAAVPDHHPLTAKVRLRWSDLSSISVILRSNQGDLSDYRALAARMGDLPLNCDLHDVSRGTLIEMVRRGMGATLLLASTTEPRAGITYRPMEDDNAFIWIEAVWPKHDRNPLRHRFLNCVRRHAAARQAAIDLPSPA